MTNHLHIRAGSVTLKRGSNRVVGLGTNWQVAGITTGDAFNVSGLTGYVDTVTDDHELTLTQPWPGASGRGRSYLIERRGHSVRIVENQVLLEQIIRKLESGLFVEADAFGTLGERSRHEGAEKNFVYRVTDDASGDLVSYIKTGNGAGNWAGPFKMRGEKGEKGEAGLPGVDGRKGERGPQGPRGERGEAGAKGPKGETGERGPAGGPQGPQGPRGPKGSEGKQGERGLMGSEGKAGPKGERGPAGERGKTGAKGPKGEKGEAGPQGERGDSLTRGGTIYGDVKIHNYNKGSALRLDANIGHDRYVCFSSNPRNRFTAGVDGAAEKGGNTGSNFHIRRFDDDGTSLGEPFSISRKSGVVRMPGQPYVRCTFKVRMRDRLAAFEMKEQSGSFALTHDGQRITVPQTGAWLISAAAFGEMAGTFSLHKNGALQYRFLRFGLLRLPVPGDSGRRRIVYYEQHVSNTFRSDLREGDYLELSCNTGLSDTDEADNHFQMIFLG